MPPPKAELETPSCGAGSDSLGCSSKKENKANADDIESSIQANADEGCGAKLHANQRRPNASNFLGNSPIASLTHDLSCSSEQQINHASVDRNCEPELNR